MKKNIFILAAAAAFAVSSCSNEEMPVPAGGDGAVTFTATLPTELNSRAFGEAAFAKQLHYAVYEAGKDAVLFTSGADGSPVATAVGNNSFTISFNLVKGNSYDFIFWADAASGSPYTFSAADKSVAVAYDEPVAANDDSRDAFFQAIAGYTVSGPAQEGVQLRRPFAQLNFGTNDLAVVEKNGVGVGTVTVALAGVPDKLNLLSGIATGENKVSFSGAMPEDETFPVAGCDYLSMNYVLTGAELEGTDVQAAKRQLIDASMTVAFTNGKTNTVNVPNLPVQRNYRTNVYGALLTSPVDVTVDVEPGFGGGDIDKPVAGPWDGTTVEAPAVDDEARTVAIASPAEFVGFMQMVNGTGGSAARDFAGYTVTLAGDVDFGGNEVPMIAAGATRSGSGANGAAFAGVIDGNGATISNFKIANAGGGNTATGFIANLKGADAALRNVKFANVDISATTSEQTAIVGLLSGGATVENVSVLSGSVKGTEATAGIVGRILGQGTVQNCSNAAAVTASAHNSGGIVGAAYYNNNGMKILNCENKGAVSGNTVVGGIVGLNCGEIKGCSNSGAVTGTRGSVGGIVGEQQNSGAVTDCHNTAEVKVTVADSGIYGTGGVVGWIRYSGAAKDYPNKNVITVSGCSNSAEVTGNIGVAGIVGMIYTYGTVDRCTNTAPKLVSLTEGFVSGIANQQNNAENAVEALGDPKIVISNNVSTTTLDNMITGSLKAQYVYLNSPDIVVEENNTDVLP